jgi:hypothetical protein
VKNSLNCPRTEAERTKNVRHINRKASGRRFSVLVVLTFSALINPSTASIASQTTVPAQTGSAPLQNYILEGDGYEGAANRFASARIDVSQDISFSQLLTEVDQNHVRDVGHPGTGDSRHPDQRLLVPDLCAERPDAGEAAL